MLLKNNESKITQYIDISNFVKQSFRQKQLNESIFKQGAKNWDEISTFSLDLRETLKKEYPFFTLTVAKVFESTDGQVEKILFNTLDGLSFESVLLRHKKDRNTVCVSTQIGCSMGCKFCATGQMGFTRNLDYREIVDQILYFKNQLAEQSENITNVVFMGMGEPFLNSKNLEDSIQILTDADQMGMSSRRLTISTVGLPRVMKNFFEKYPQINLAISLHSAVKQTRESIMPIASKISLEDLALYIDWHVKTTGRRISLEYLMMKGINDSREDLENLISYVKNSTSNWRKMVHINLIPLNKVEGSDFEPSDRAILNDFVDSLSNSGIKVTVRKSLGSSEEAACGMLKTKS